MQLGQPGAETHYAEFYRKQLLEDVMPFWVRHGPDAKNGGIFTALDRDGSLLDTDKSVWFQGRAGWMFGHLYRTMEARPEWLQIAQSCADFSLQHCHSVAGKMFFSVTEDGQPLRMRRYVFSESFAAISYASMAAITGQQHYRDAALAAWQTYLRYSFQPGVMPAKMEPTRPTMGLGPHMISIVTAQELRGMLGEVTCMGRDFSQWISYSIAEILTHFYKPELGALMEVVGAKGEVLNHIDGRTLNPGHAIECAWFLMQEGQHLADPELIQMGCHILDWMWTRGWDQEYGGLLYFTDVYGRPVQEYWHDMKFWWPHCEAIIATLMAWQLTGQPRYAAMHRQVHDWSFQHFPDREHGEWYGYLNRSGSPTQGAKGNLYKGPFHLPRMLAICAQRL
jgi:N-acylglucosamine 2-epimerase